LTEIRRLAPGDAALVRGLNAMFAAAFEETETYAGAPPGEAYLEALLRREHVIALAALADGQVIGGLVAYELDKFERERREIYIYDLAVADTHRRRGVASALIARLRAIARERGAWMIYVQADYVDPPAIALYEKLGRREEVLHFDIDVSE
jgi:aminoglycoside 3-N-acetyltransferase I